MKATELIKRLQELVDEYGDLEIKTRTDGNYDYSDQCYASSVTNAFHID